MKRPRNPIQRTRYTLTLLCALTFWGLLPAGRQASFPGPPSSPDPGASTESPTPHRTFDTQTPDAPEAPAHWSDAPESDVVAEPYPLRVAQLQGLTTGATLTLPDPNGGEVTLRVDAIRTDGDSQHLRLSHGGLPSSVTISPRQFFATIATPGGVYALSGDGHGTRLIRHAELDQRNLHESDYRSARL